MSTKLPTLTSEEERSMRFYINEGTHYWTRAKLLAHEFEPTRTAKFYGFDGRKERAIVRRLQGYGLIESVSDATGVYKFTELGVVWLFWYRHTTGDYPLPPWFPVHMTTEEESK